jgi:hypothetical protein
MNARRCLCLCSVIPISPALNRILHAGLSLCLGAILLLFAFLTPNPEGKGTHRYLGLPDCLISRLTGLDCCPSCGLTTAFCYLMHGELEKARLTHAAILPLFLLWLFLIIYSAWMAIIGKNWLFIELYICILILMILFACWLGAFITHAASTWTSTASLN